MPYGQAPYGQAPPYGYKPAPLDRFGRPLAEWWQRLLGIVIDWLILGVPKFVLTLVIFGVTNSGGVFSVGWGVGLVVMGIVFAVIDLGYFAILNGGEKGQTVGQMALGITVRDEVNGWRRRPAAGRCPHTDPLPGHPDRMDPGPRGAGLPLHPRRRALPALGPPSAGIPRQGGPHRRDQGPLIPIRAALTTRPSLRRRPSRTWAWMSITLVALAAAACSSTGSTQEASTPSTIAPGSPWLGTLAAVTLPPPVNSLTSLDCVSSLRCWAVGSTVGGAGRTQWGRGHRHRQRGRRMDGRDHPTHRRLPVRHLVQRPASLHGRGPGHPDLRRAGGHHHHRRRRGDLGLQPPYHPGSSTSPPSPARPTGDAWPPEPPPWGRRYWRASPAQPAWVAARDAAAHAHRGHRHHVP